MNTNDINIGINYPQLNRLEKVYARLNPRGASLEPRIGNYKKEPPRLTGLDYMTAIGIMESKCVYGGALLRALFCDDSERALNLVIVNFREEFRARGIDKTESEIDTLASLALLEHVNGFKTQRCPQCKGLGRNIRKGTPALCRKCKGKSVISFDIKSYSRLRLLGDDVDFARTHWQNTVEPVYNKVLNRMAQAQNDAITTLYEIFR